MQTPIEVTFRELPVSDAVENACLDHVAKLEKYCDRLTGCRVAISKPHRSHRKGNLYSVDIDVTLPRGEIVVNRTPPLHASNEDVYVALKDAFATMRRRLEDHLRRRRAVHPDAGRSPATGSDG